MKRARGRGVVKAMELAMIIEAMAYLVAAVTLPAALVKSAKAIAAAVGSRKA